MKLIIDRQKVYAQHGVLDQEHAVGAYYYISVEAETTNTKSIDTDALRDTINYADIAQIIKREMEIPSRLLEHVAGRIARHILTEYPTVHHIKVRIMKENPPMGIECLGAGVEIEMDNNL